MTTEIAVEELETRYFEIMKQVCQGESFTVAVDGRAVAEIRPRVSAVGKEDMIKVLEELCTGKLAGASDAAIREWLGEAPG